MNKLLLITLTTFSLIGMESPRKETDKDSKTREYIDTLLALNTAQNQNTQADLQRAEEIEKSSFFSSDMNLLTIIPLTYLVEKMETTQSPLQEISLTACVDPNFPSSTAGFTVLKFAAEMGRLTAVEVFLSKIPTEYLNTPFISGLVARVLTCKNRASFAETISLLQKYKFDFNQAIDFQKVIFPIPALTYYISATFPSLWTKGDDSTSLDEKLRNTKLLLVAGADPLTPFTVNNTTLEKSNTYEYAKNFQHSSEIYALFDAHLGKVSVKTEAEPKTTTKTCLEKVEAENTCILS
jgi:hypothetical protein